MINKLTLNTVYAITLFSFAGGAAACNDGAGDDCKDHLYLADSSEPKFSQIAAEQKTLKLSEASISQGAVTDVRQSTKQRFVNDHSINNDIDSDNFNWVPDAWVDLY